jgi:hypothetical protein
MSLRDAALLSVVLAGGCTARPLPIVGGGGAIPVDFADSGTGDLSANPALFIGTFSWDGTQSSVVTVCDNGASATDHPSGPFPITAGPAADQVNIGAGTKACPIFIFDVQGPVATLSNLGVTCSSGGGTLTTRSGMLTPVPNAMQISLVLDAEEPNGGGGFVHCTLTVTGTAKRLH